MLLIWCETCNIRVIEVVVFGIIYCFTYFTITPGKKVCFIIIYYNLNFATYFFGLLSQQMGEKIVIDEYWIDIWYILCNVMMIIGLIFMIAYYACFHPKPGQRGQDNGTESDDGYDDVCYCLVQFLQFFSCVS